MRKLDEERILKEEKEKNSSKNQVDNKSTESEAGQTNHSDINEEVNAEIKGSEKESENESENLRIVT